MDDVEAALQALGQLGRWIGRADADAEMVRVEIRRAARQRGIRVRTFIDAIGRPHATTPDGLPAEEPWRGAAVHAYDSGVIDEVVANAMEKYRTRPKED
ncbi:hypothetical protein [Geodermatophilus sp. SYSU D00696]